MKNKILVSVLFALALFRLMPVKAYASIYEEEQPSRKIVVDKKIKPVYSFEWKDNLPASEITFKAGEPVEFKLIVRNDGNADLTEIKVTDTLPEFVTLVLHNPSAKIDGRTLSWTIDRLSPGESREFKLRVHVMAKDKLPQAGIIPATNKVIVEPKEAGADEDTATFYINTQAAAEQLPASGAGLLTQTVLAGSLLAFGIFCRKFGRGEILS